MPNNYATSIGARFALAAAIAAACGTANAAGFALIENSASGMGNAFAGAAAIAEDASTVWFNPAGMTRLDGDQVVVAGHYIEPEASCTDRASGPMTGPNDTTDEAAFVTNFYYVRDLGDDVKFGFGINTPFGLTTEYDPAWIGRYHAIRSDIMTVNFNPALASKVTDKLSLGLGFNVQYIEAEITSAVDPLLFGGTSDGLARVEGDDVSFGANFGLLYEYSPRSRMGVAYRSKVAQTLEGTASFEGTNPVPSPLGGELFLNTGATAGIDLPETVSFSYAREVDAKWTFLADVTWTGWRGFEELRVSYDNSGQPDAVTTEHWRNTWRYAVGANYRWDDRLTLRAGVAYDETPIPNAERRTPRIPGNDRTWVSLGFGYAYSPRLQFDVGYSHLFVDDADIHNTLESPFTPYTLDGTYESHVDIVSTQATWKF